MNLMKEKDIENTVDANTENTQPSEKKSGKIKQFFVDIGQKINSVPLWEKILILAALCTLDYFTCLVLLIGTVIFMQTGNRGLAITLAVCNLIFPDTLPVVDEAFSVLAVLIPLIIEYNKTGSIKLATEAGLKSKKELKKNRKDVKGAVGALMNKETEKDTAIEEKKHDE